METTNINPEALRLKKLAEPYKVKSFDLNRVKDVDTTKRVVTGISNAFYYFDSDWDVLLPGSTLKSIEERGPNTNVAGKIKHALFHDLTKLPGKNQVLDERRLPDGVTGQYFETRMLNTADGNDTLIKYQEGVYDQHSIGFRYLDVEMIDAESDEWDKWMGQLINPEDAENVGFMFLVKEIKQYEFSTVAFGANSLTPYLGVKSENKETVVLKLNTKIDSIVKLLRNGKGITDEGFYNLELELHQLKQLQMEALLSGPSVKDTLIKMGRPAADTHKKVMCPGCNYEIDMATAQESGMGYVNCPSCGEPVTTQGGKTWDLSAAIKETRFF